MADKIIIVHVMRPPSSYRDILETLRPLSRLAAAIGEPEVNVRAWKRLDSIPPHAWDRVVAYARAVGHRGVSLSALSRIAAAKRGAAA
ncbi:hypothetical protein [Ferrovibrio sp.]|uniref:hypothetical protein n=1 Tax=Ferrovibrio sp. TaxID=1917215 RepID=UPI00311E7607